MTKPTETGPRAATRSRRWPTILLAVSLALNLAVVGVIAGAYFREDRDARRFPPPDRTMMRATGFGPFFEAMPRGARNRMGEAMRGQEGRFAPDRAALAAEVRDMLNALRAEPFDPQALEAVLAAQHARAQARVEAGRAVLVDQIAAMTADERTNFAAELEARFARALDGQGPRDRD